MPLLWGGGSVAGTGTDLFARFECGDIPSEVGRVALGGQRRKLCRSDPADPPRGLDGLEGCRDHKMIVLAIRQCAA